MVDKPWLKFWPEDIPQSIGYPKTSLFSFLEKSAQLYPNFPAIIFYGKRITYKELHTLSCKFATALHALDVKKGDRVAVFLPNLPQFVISFYGILKIGAVVTPVNPLFAEEELKYQLTDAEAETIVVHDVLYPRVRRIWTKTELKRVIVTNIKEYLPRLKRVFGRFPTFKVDRHEPDVYFFQDLVEKAPCEPPKEKIDSMQDLAALYYTSGVTSTPKGVMLTHYNLVSNALMFTEWIHGRSGKEVFLPLLPLSYLYGTTTCMNTSIHLASTMILLSNIDFKTAFKSIEKYHVTVLCGTPTTYKAFTEHPELPYHRLSSIRLALCCAGPIPLEIQREFARITGRILVGSYGLTEASPLTHCNPVNYGVRKKGSVGLPLPDTDVAIIDLKSGRRVVSPEKIGEIAVKGPQVMKGYWKNPKETRLVLRDGWLRTGDIGKMDKRGYFYILDRKKDLVKQKRWVVSPRELEKLICKHSAVKMCAVVGKPVSPKEEILKAFVVLKEEEKVSEQELMEFVAKKVPAYKRVREVEFRKELPLSPFGEVLRRVLREEEMWKAKVNLEK